MFVSEMRRGGGRWIVVKDGRDSLALVRLVDWTLKRHAEKSRESSSHPLNNAAAILSAAQRLS